jgi:hypothetical protein
MRGIGIDAAVELFGRARDVRRLAVSGDAMSGQEIPRLSAL